MKRLVNVKDDSFNRAGITKDKIEAICEYIWNGFEADATSVIVKQIGEPLISSLAIQIEDNGNGIPFNTLEDTFGAFLSSSKPIANIRIKTQPNKGKGRFSYLCFSNEAKWATTYCEEEKYKSYSITLNKSERNAYYADGLSEVSAVHTGTIVEIPIIRSEDQELLSYEDVYEKLLEEFSWYLYLNQNKNIQLEYCGTKLNYLNYIDSELSSNRTISIYDNEFTIDIIVWKSKVANSSMIFYMNSRGEVRHSETTKFNRNTAEFYHAVFIRSNYFDKNIPIFTNTESNDLSVIEMVPNQRNTMVELNKITRDLVGSALNEFLLRKADEQLKRMEGRNSFPRFSDDEYGQVRKNDFQRVARALYCAEPKIFYKLKPAQEKSLLGFLDLLLNSDERENVLTIVESVVNLTPEERQRFVNILNRSKLSHILDVMNLIQNRYEIVQQLQTIVFDHARLGNERDVVQKIIEHHYWIFGEQYNLMSADERIKKLLEKFEETFQVNVVDTSTLTEQELLQRMDIFLYSTRITESGTDECLIVELKAPYISLTLDVYNQIERYAYTVLKEPRFQSIDRVFKFIAVCSTVSDEVKVKYDNFSQHGKKCLAGIVKNFEIYAMSWDDVFTSFFARHQFLLEKLKLDYEETMPTITEEDDVPTRETVINRTKSILDNKFAIM